MVGWIEMRCSEHRLKGKMHVAARVIEFACRHGKGDRKQPHAFDYFDADTGRQLHYIEVRFRLASHARDRLDQTG